MRTGWLGIVLLVCGLESVAWGKSHVFGWEDMFSAIRIGDPQVSPDGNLVLYSRSAYSLDKNQKNVDLAVAGIDGVVQRRLTSDPAVDANPRWLKDGRNVLFLSNRSGSMQLWKISIDGGEPIRVSNLPLDIEGFELAPGGDKVVFWASVFPDCKELACSAKRLKEMDADPVKARVFERLFIRHWDSWADGRRNHLFVMDLDDQKPIDLMPGWDQDAPTKPWGGGDEIAWSVDGKTIAFASKPSKDEPWHTNVEIYLTRADGKGRPRCITKDNPAWDTGPSFSPDGRMLAYRAMDRAGFEADKFHVVLRDLKTNQVTHLTRPWDRSVGGLVWSSDSSMLYTTADEHGKTKIFALDTSSGNPRVLVEDGGCGSLGVTRVGTLVFAKSRLTHPVEIFVLNPATGQTTQITHENRDSLAQVRMSQPEEFWFGHNGRKLHGWLLKPVDFRPGKKYPLAFLIHGGPQGSWTDSFHYRWNPQFYAGGGYVTVAIDFRGSTGYGQAFTDAISGDWGPGPYSDLMAGLEFVLANYKYVDKNRMCALGASYGGYMINWIAGQKHPFKCLVNHDGNFDTASMYFTTEELWFPEWEMGGTPWEKPKNYERHSPMRHVENWNTPMLVVQGALDFRIPESESFATFTALQRKGIPSKFLYFPDENHWVLKSLNSKLWHRTVLAWLDRWCGVKRAGQAG